MHVSSSVRNPGFITDAQLRDGHPRCAYSIWCCVCTVVSSGCSQFGQKWWGRVRPLLGVMRLPAAPHCLTKSPSVSLPSRLVFAQRHTSPLNHMRANMHKRVQSPLTLVLNVYSVSLSLFFPHLSYMLSWHLPFLFLFPVPLLLASHLFSPLSSPPPPPSSVLSQQESCVIGLLSTAH